MNITIDHSPAEIVIGTHVVSVRPLALGFQRRMKERGIICPAPPKQVTRDSAGRVARDDRGEPVLVADDSDATYQAHVERYHERVAALMIVEAIGHAAEFDAGPPETDADWQRYADAILDELRAAGWTTGDLVRVCQAACEASRLTSASAAAATNDFFSPPATARSSPA